MEPSANSSRGLPGNLLGGLEMVVVAMMEVVVAVAVVTLWCSMMVLRSPGADNRRSFQTLRSNVGTAAWTCSLSRRSSLL